MDNNFNSENEMASSCNQILYCDDRHTRRSCNRLTHKKHLRNRTELIALTSLALSLFFYQNKTFVEGIQIVSKEFKSEIYSEFETIHIPQFSTDTYISEDKMGSSIKLEKVAILSSDSNDNVSQHLNESNNNMQDRKETNDKTNNFVLNTEGNENVVSSDTINSDKIHSEFATDYMPEFNMDEDISEETTESLDKFNKVPTPASDNESYNDIQDPHDKNNNFVLSSEINAENEDISDFPYSSNLPSHNLEISIRNSVKSLIENEQYLESSSALEILEKLSDVDNLEKNTKRIYSKKDNFPTFQHGAMEINKTHNQAEVPTNNFDQQEINNKFTTKKLNKYKDDIKHNINNKTLTSLSLPPTSNLPIKINCTDMVEDPEKIVNTLPEKWETQIKHSNKQNSQTKAQPLLTFDSSEFVTHNYDNNYNDNILSVDLNETISTAPNNIKDANFLDIEEYPKSYLEEIMNETENNNDTSIDEELEHVVIKKVLDTQEMFDDLLITTSQKNEIQLTYEQESDTKISDIDAGYQNSNKTLNMELLDDGIASYELVPENITVSTCIENCEENNISTTDVYYQSTEAIEQYESIYLFNKNCVDLVHSGNESDIVLLTSDIDQQSDQDAPLKRFENVQNKPEVYENRSEFWISQDKPSKQEITVTNSMENITEFLVGEIDKNLAMETTEKYKSNTNLFKNIRNKHLNLIERENYQHHTNQNVSLKDSENKQHGPKRSEGNISRTVIPYINKFTEETEKYGTNYNIANTIQNEEIEISERATMEGYRPVSRQFDDIAATLFESFPPRDAGQTLNDNLADESAGIGKALPVSTAGGSNRSTIIIILSSGTAIVFIIISVTIFLISFQSQHGTLDIEMQERNCGKDDLDEEDAQTFTKLLEVELSPSVAVTLDESDECL